MFKQVATVIFSMTLFLCLPMQAHANSGENWFLFGKNSPLMKSEPKQGHASQKAGFGTTNRAVPQRAAPIQRPQVAPTSYRQPQVRHAAPSRPPVPAKYNRQRVDYTTKHPKGTIIVDTGAKFLYLVEGNGKAMRYGIGVARSGFEWSGTHRITRKAEWPGWTPPAEMRKREPHLPAFMPGGPDNPLGARALYLGSTLYRIHGTAQPWTIGHNVSSGCIRLKNEDVIDLYTRVSVGAKVIVQ